MLIVNRMQVSFIATFFAFDLVRIHGRTAFSIHLKLIKTLELEETNDQIIRDCFK